MKKTIILTVAAFIAASVFAQVPPKMSYQAVVRDADNKLVTNTRVGIEVNIYQGSVTGTQVYTETQTPTTNANGLLTIEIGGQTGFDTITWTNGPYFLETKIDPTGGSNYTITGTNRLLTVPYALHAKTAESITGTVNETDPLFSAWDKSYSDLSGTPSITDTVTAVLDSTTRFVRKELDDDPNNEIQTISRSGLTVTLSNGGGTYRDSVNTQTLSSVLKVGNDAGNRNITNLADPVNAQDAVTKKYLLEIINALNKGVTDIDGNHYNAILIGNQIWMDEDLRVTHYPNGDPIPNITDNSVWDNLHDNNTDDAYCFYNNNSGTDYGALYTYAAAIADNWTRDNSSIDEEGGQGVCPDGWHLPTFAEWETLINYLGGENVAGGKIKETGTTHWKSPNTGANNSSKFTALPGGLRTDSGLFYLLTEEAIWRSATESEAESSSVIVIYYNQAIAERFPIHRKSRGISVRCIKN